MYMYIWQSDVSIRCTMSEITHAMEFSFAIATKAIEDMERKLARKFFRVINLSINFTLLKRIG